MSAAVEAPLAVANGAGADERKVRRELEEMEKTVRALQGLKRHMETDTCSQIMVEIMTSIVDELSFDVCADVHRAHRMDLLPLDDAACRKMFAGGPVRRAGHVRFLRNVLVAAGNSGDAELVPAIKALLVHDSPLIRGMAVWALRCLLDGDDYRVLRAIHVPHEGDETVLGEWD